MRLQAGRDCTRLIISVFAEQSKRKSKRKHKRWRNKKKLKIRSACASACSCACFGKFGTQTRYYYLQAAVTHWNLAWAFLMIDVLGRGPWPNTGAIFVDFCNCL